MTASPPCACADTGQPCGCCAGITDDTPVSINNRPGLAEISYRPGAWAEFKSSMLADLSTTHTLAGLRTRDDDDFTIALLDSWAVVCDILTFYQERIANEAYLRTATELLSVGELAKLIGYKLRPGLAAAAPLAFSLTAPAGTPPGPNTPPSGAPSSVIVPAGSQAQTVPDPGAQPATFETVSAISARAEWNAIKVRMTLPVAAVNTNADADMRLVGVTPAIKVGDTLMVAASDADSTTMLNRVASIKVDTDTKTTVVGFEAGTSQVAADPPSVGPPALPTTASLNSGFLWEYVKGQAWPDQIELAAYATKQGWSLDTFENAVNALRGSHSPGAEPPLQVYAMGTDAAVFGHNAPAYRALPKATKAALPNWENDSLDANASTALPWIDLDNVYPVNKGDQVALVAYFAGFMPLFHGSGGGPLPVLGAGWQTFFTTVTDVQVVTRSAYLLASKITTIQVASTPEIPWLFGIRGTRVLIETPPRLVLADVLIDEPVEGGQVTLDGAYLSLTVGQQVAVTGIRADNVGITASEVVTIAGLELVDGYTVLTFGSQLAGHYVRSSVTINANVAPATHGVTTTQILGSGDASQAFQSFALNQTPLTYVSAATPSGTASTLTVTVDGVKWVEVQWLYNCQPTDRVYTVLSGVDGKTYIRFGDGVTGARPGSGTNNIVATYRYGIGSAGLARPGQISTLLSRSFGLNAVVNPGASTGAADPETAAQARTGAPASVMTLGRIVSLEDVADFAAASAGIAKAAVHWTWDGVRYSACATVAGIGGAPVVAGTDQYRNLLAAMVDASDGTLPVALCSYRSLTFSVGAAVTPDPSLDSSLVLADVKSALAAAFGFDNRAFGQPVYASEVIEVIQDVSGVVATTLTALNYTGATPAAPAAGLPAPTATLGPQGLLGAVLLTIEAGTLPGVVIAS
ncbi:hypothetical protein BOO86_01440 [Mycobacterium sp. CBMA 234]|uniref:hypothetical protein n=1 Tax=Mycolicibacterium sp. CBMA 234 TaxID=1918495 RepID=UPI0012DCCE38|nr:hypothetical protein [Mycolicibacterium sp. CBMA 234]MUL63113.1 hypothetical protein [Mycolicibacterium sp. CBMA 234]